MTLPPKPQIDVELPLFLTVRVFDAKDLARADAVGNSDPYVRLLWNGKEVGRTKAVDNTLNPVWNYEKERFTMPMGNNGPDDQGKIPEDTLVVQVFDKDANASLLLGGSPNGSFLGQVVVPARDFHPPYKTVKVDYMLDVMPNRPLEDQKLVQGEVALHLVGHDTPAPPPAQVDESFAWTGGDEFGEEPRRWVQLHVQRAENLRAADALGGVFSKFDQITGGGKSDPYAIVFWNRKEMGRSKVVNNNLDPEFESASKAEFHTHKSSIQISTN